MKTAERKINFHGLKPMVFSCEVRNYLLHPRAEARGFRKLNAVNKKLLIVGVVLGVLALAQVWVSNRLVTKGVEMTEITRKFAALNQENLAMRQKLSGRTALSNISVEAEKMGFVQASQVASANSILPVAEKLTVTAD